MESKNKFQELIDLGYIVRPPIEIKDYYTIGKRPMPRYLHIPNTEQWNDMDSSCITAKVIDSLNTGNNFYDLKVHCICDSDSCPMEHHQCTVYNFNPFADCIHITMRDKKSECYGCNELWEEITDTKELCDSLIKELDKEKKNVHNILMEYHDGYRERYEKLING